MQRLFISSTVIAVVVVLVWLFIGRGNTGRIEGEEAATSTATVSSWTWENPYTFKQLVIPSGWNKVENEQLRDAVLALQHDSGKCLIYITYDESVSNLALAEYIDAVTPMNQKEFGITEFTKVTGRGAKEIYQAEGAKYMGDSLVGVDIRIWSDGFNGFWETVVMTDLEYKTIEYDARELVNVVAETTM